MKKKELIPNAKVRADNPANKKPSKQVDVLQNDSEMSNIMSRAARGENINREEQKKLDKFLKTDVKHETDLEYELVKSVLKEIRPRAWNDSECETIRKRIRHEVEDKFGPGEHKYLKIAVDYLDKAIGRHENDSENMLFKVFWNDFRYKELKKGVVIKSNYQSLLARLVMASVDYGDFISPRKDISQNSYYIQISHLATSNAPVLIVGETGTSKSRMAKAIHKMSDRRDKPFRDINCAGIHEGLFESLLFGIEKGVATLVERRIGILEQANEGTVFLDEIAKMPQHSQVKLLKAIEDQEFYMVGGGEPIKVDVRVIAAAQPVDLKENQIHKDLIYRLGSKVETLPLRERLKMYPKEIIMRTLANVSKKFNVAYEGRPDAAVLDLLAKYSYPGNYRELERILLDAIISAKTHGRNIAVADIRIDSLDEQSDVLPGLQGIEKIPLKDIVVHADRVAAEIIKAKIRQVKDIKNTLIAEGYPHTLTNFHNIIKKRTNKTLRQIKAEGLEG